MKKIILALVAVQMLAPLSYASSDRFVYLLSQALNMVKLDSSKISQDDQKFLLCKTIGQETNDASVVKFSMENFTTCQQSNVELEKIRLCFAMGHMADTTSKNQFDQETFTECLNSEADLKKILMCGDIGFEASEDRWVQEVNPEVFSQCLAM